MKQLNDLEKTILTDLEKIYENEAQRIKIPQGLTEIQIDCLKKIAFLRKAWLTWENLQQGKLSLSKGTIDSTLIKLEYHKNFLMAKFFELQESIQKYLGQTLQIAYVTVSKNGTRSIKLFEETVDKISGRWSNSSAEPEYKQLSSRGNQYLYKIKNYDDSVLQKTAKEVTNRYKQSVNKIVYWYNTVQKKQLKGAYQLYTMGPINEAFVAFYINQFKTFGSNLEQRVETYVTHKKYGIVQADNRNGFIYGDVSKDKTQYAVKGKSSQPQNIALVLKNLDNLENAIKKSPQAVKKFFNSEEFIGGNNQWKNLTQEVVGKTLEEIDSILNEINQ